MYPKAFPSVSCCMGGRRSNLADDSLVMRVLMKLLAIDPSSGE